jgi:hypothetical protein
MVPQMKRNFKFIGGPWDGEYHEIDTDRLGHSVNVRQFKPFNPFESLEEPVLDEEGEPVLDTFGQPMMTIPQPKFRYTRYTLRHMDGEGGPVYYFAPDNWSDMYTLSQFVHHYQGSS